MPTQIQTTSATSEVTVNLATGEAFISQRKAAIEIGIPRPTLQSWIDRHPDNYDVSQGLSSEIFSLAIQYYALDSKAATPEAKELLRKISQAGAKAYLYHEAGVTLNAVTQQPRPLTYIESLELLLASEKEKEALRIEDLKKSAIITDKRNITNEGEDYFTTARIKELNPGKTLSGQLLSREARKQGITPIRQFSTYSTAITPNSYHRDVWNAVYPKIVLPN